MHQVLIVVFDGVQGLDVTGPADVFAGANRVLGRTAYDVTVCGPHEAVTTGSAVHMLADPLPPDASRATVLVPGGGPATQGTVAVADVEVWLADADPSRVATVCTGAFVAARAGLLDGHRVTTHWSETSRLAEEFPHLTVAGRELYVHDRDVWSSGGVTAGVDMALAMVADDHGTDVARTISRWLVMYLHRPGTQDQFAGPVWHRPSSETRVERVREHVLSVPGADHSVDRLADMVGLSSRHLQRLFVREVGAPLGLFITQARVEAAKHELIGTDRTMSSVARDTGFGSAESMRRSFHEHLGVSPHDYRNRFTKP